MKIILQLTLLAAVASAPACSTTEVRDDPGTVRVHVVINKLKEQLGTFGAEKWKTSVEAGADDKCKSINNKHEVFVRPVSAKVSLKTVLGREQSTGGGFELPLNVLTIAPSFSGTYNHVDTNTLDIEFALPEEQATAPIDFQAAPNQTELYRAIAEAAKEITLVDHGRTPCLTPKTMKATVTFAVSSKEGGGVDIKVLGIKFGGKVTVTNDQQQTLEVLFSLTGSSEVFKVDTQ